MDTLDFLKEKERMCINYDQCIYCPLSRLRNSKAVLCTDLEYEYPEKVIEIVEQWSKEHPKKTRQSEFLKMFPNTSKHYNVIDICPKFIEKSLYHTQDCLGKICIDCKRKFWLEEIE